MFKKGGCQNTGPNSHRKNCDQDTKTDKQPYRTDGGEAGNGDKPPSYQTNWLNTD